MADLQNEFSWSWSRHQTFEACGYRYWMMYYGSWGGWKAGAPADVRRRYVEKKLSNRFQWAGIVVHEVAAGVLNALREGRRPSPERVVAHTKKRVALDLREAAGGGHTRAPTKVLGLQEHYYRDQAGVDALPEMAERVVRQVEGLFANPVFQRLSHVPDQIVEVENLHRITLVGVPVWVSLDVLVRAADRFVVVDWKSGDHHAAAAVSAQLGVYVADVLQRFLGHDDPTFATADELARVSTLAAYVADGGHHTASLSLGDLLSTLDTIRNSSAHMRSRLDDVDRNLATEANFDRLALGSSECARCGLRGACGRS